MENFRIEEERDANQPSQAVMYSILRQNDGIFKQIAGFLCARILD